ncbi:MAG: isoprenylcysteine carboxylmethyltransferase family protein [Flavobacteriales bacterium]|nr:isoprenylcysteine carboxylmethyltransferase family protein [Flavobacteriales bacterium]MBK7940775.1 isoprenylcysteine carboxylmethyltransferase family protein [Flavobacteriales bacterium]MBK9700806.1 isoprenylcysteine carboxylmethyltransferase family protein [Flavobacteriales bacterium]
MKRPLRSFALVSAQFTLLAGLALTAPWAALGALRITLFAASLLLVGWAMLAMGGRTFSVFPEPRPDARLTLRGPYRWVRHPMYLAVLLAAVAVGSAPPLGPHTGFALFLVPVVVAKVRVEERLLGVAFPDRGDRMRGVARLVPGVW